jgi:hypothetical protein
MESKKALLCLICVSLVQLTLGRVGFASSANEKVSPKDYKTAVEYVKLSKEKDKLVKERVELHSSYTEGKKDLRKMGLSQQVTIQKIEELESRERDNLGAINKKVAKLEKRLAELQKRIKKNKIDQKLPGIANNPPTLIDPNQENVKERDWVRIKNHYKNGEVQKVGQYFSEKERLTKENQLKENAKRSTRSDKNLQERPIKDSESSDSSQTPSRSFRAP